ncbi:MAG: hypothetical protein R2734_20050 [Nocardioides sp.]
MDYHTGDLYDLEPVNFTTGESNVFDTNVALLPVWKSSIGLPANSSQTISYAVGTWDGYYGVTTDQTAPKAFDAGKPMLTTASPLWEDQGNTRIGYTKRVSGKVKVLLVHLHGAKGAREQVLTVR